MARVAKRQYALAVFAVALSYSCFASAQSKSTRKYFFNITSASIPFAQTLPLNTKKQLTQDLPDSIAAVVVRNDEHEEVLVGPPIHIRSGERLELSLKNNVQFTGLSIHLHGLGFDGAFEYDGAVGVSQCPLAEGDTFVYDVAVDDRPGTYWYHTSSGHLGVDAYDAIRGPLIIHPEGSEDLVNTLNAPSSLPSGYSPLAYKRERVIFLQDGFLSSSALRYSEQVGNLVPPPSKSKDGIIVATFPWQFGTCNGKLRDVVHVYSNRKYKFRVINGGQHHALRFSVDRFPLTVVAADSQAVEAYTVDEIIIHVGERFDVEVLVYDDIEDGELFWIRADTLESQRQGFQNGIRAIMRVADENSVPPNDDVPDPPLKTVSRSRKHRDTKTLNCYTPGCIPITWLTPMGIVDDVEVHDIDSEIHSVDTHYQPAPQYGHFVSIDGSTMTQNELPPAAMISRTFRPDNSVHPNSMALRVSRSSPVIVVWRTTLLMDVPIHLHGHSVEILDTAHPKLQQDCNLHSCRLSQAFESKSKLKALDKTPYGQSIKKDTFVIPAGGAIVTRLHTGHRGLWMVNGQKDIHDEDGMSFVLIVGDYRIPRDDDWPSDFPTCNSTLVKSMIMKPHCQCYIDENAPFQNENQERKFCSRSHLCRHELSQAAKLDSYVYDQGFNIQYVWSGIPGILLTGIFLLVIVANTILLVAFPSKGSQPSSNEPQSNYGRVLRRLSSLGIGSKLPQRRKTNIDINVSSSRDSGLSLGMSIVASEHIGTIEHISEEEEYDDDDSSFDYDDDIEEDSSASDADMPLPPPPPHRLNRADNANSPVRLPPLQPQLHPRSRQGSQSRSGNHLLTRQSSMSTFDRIFSERGYDGNGNNPDLKDAFDFLLDGYSVRGSVKIEPVDEVVNKNSSFTKQSLYILPTQWQTYFSSSVNMLRFVEVAGLAALTGGIFQSTGSDNSQATVTELSSLVLVLTSTWTFSRLYFAVSSQHDWFKTVQVIFRYKRFSLLPVFMTRMTVMLLCESVFPTISTFICFPMAGLVGDIRSLCNISFLLASNNVCYLFIGSALGMFTSASNGMIAATVCSQISILTAGIFTELPASLVWARYFSPFYWTVQGLLKSVYRWSDTYSCIHGSSSEIGANQCFIEYDSLIEQYKRRGLHVAQYNDPSSDSILTESIALVALGFGLHTLIFVRCFFAYYKVNWDEMNGRIRRPSVLR